MQIGPNGPSGDTHFSDNFTSLNLRTDTGGGPWTAGYSWNPNNGPGSSVAGGEAWMANPEYVNSPNYSNNPYSTTASPFTINANGAGQGGLDIHASYDANGFYNNTDPSLGATGPSYWESGRLSTGITTTSDGQTSQGPGFTQLYGYFEVSATIPAGDGWWPSFYLYSASALHGEEIDVMESYGGHLNATYPAIHDNRVPGDSGGYPDGVYGKPTLGMPSLNGEPVQDGTAYKFGVDWEPDRITFYLNDQPYFTTATPQDLVNNPMVLFLDLAVGGDGGDPGSQTSADFKIDDVKTWSSTEIDHSLLSTEGTSPTDVFTPDANTVRVEISDAGHYLQTNGLGDNFYLGSAAAYDETISGFSNLDMLDLMDVLYDASTNTGQDYITDPNLVSEGYITFLSDGSGGAYVDYSKDGSVANRVMMADLLGVDPTTLSLTNGVVTTTQAPQSPGSEVYVSDSSYTAPAGVTIIHLTGSNQTINANNAGDVIWSDNTQNTLNGGTGNDTFHLGRAGDVVSGGGGTDTFDFAEIPWAGGQITGFAGADVLDLTGLMGTTQDTGADGFADGYLKLTSDGSDGTQVWAQYATSGSNSGWWLVTTLDHVAPASLQTSGDTVSLATGPTSVTVSDPSYTAPSYVTSITLSGSQQTINASATNGVEIFSNNTGNHLTGGAGNDIFHLGRGGDVVSGGGGADVFSYAETPWAGGEIKDFSQAEHDAIDLSGLLAKSGYTGSTPFADGYLKLTDDGAGNTQLWSDINQPGNDGWWLVATIDHIASSNLHYSASTWELS